MCFNYHLEICRDIYFEWCLQKDALNEWCLCRAHRRTCSKFVAALKFGSTKQRLSVASVQGVGGYKEADDARSPPPAEEGWVPSEEREAEKWPYPQDLPERSGGSYASQLRGHISRRWQRGLKWPAAVFCHPSQLMAPHCLVQQQSLFCL